MIRLFVTHAALVFHAAMLTAAIGLAVMGAEHRSSHHMPKPFLLPSLSQRAPVSSTP